MDPGAPSARLGCNGIARLFGHSLLVGAILVTSWPLKTETGLYICSVHYSEVFTE